ncbi:VOC family protein [Antarctobacter heliothermus]|uniref:Glyoxalase/Bleomycin resistance protein/Dioxygenase superfamily protein n=1 Tax=Antarctobacter heliothermus TaxID=74033 RepID=A0A239KNA7_9RHOB|nr:VOC family protein [Antarctobacter heliothermus]SNT19545.1 Glyoxalase/Bleomycin resistance protein/Dioxygenase superfamily protein [Antarctobacter heliothermus]
MTTLGIDHLGLTVADLQASRDFFVECLGWDQFGGNPGYPAAYVTNGHAKLTLWQQVAQGADFDRRGNIGLHHFALKVPDEASLTALFDRVRAWPGVKVEFAPEFSGKGPKVHFMINEPGGTRMDFSYDPR